MTITNTYLSNLSDITKQIDWLYLTKFALIAACCVFLLGTIFRLIFGKRSGVTHAVSSTVNIFLIYLTVILLYALVQESRSFLPPLPFVEVSEDAFFLLDLRSMETQALYSPLLQLFLLAFLVNFFDSVIPHGHKLISWYLFRCLIVLICLVLFDGIMILSDRYYPELFTDWARYVLLGIWIGIAVIGLAKTLLTIVLSVINPIIGGLYAFFFSNLFGKQFSKAIVTTCLMAVLMAALYHFGIIGFVFADFSIVSCGPVCLIALVCLYLFGRFL